jgi:hypothetical protein
MGSACKCFAWDPRRFAILQGSRLNSRRGFGIRSTKEFTPLFERLVNTIHTASPASKLLFNTSPDGTLDAVIRHFPEVRAGQAA